MNVSQRRPIVVAEDKVLAVDERGIKAMIGWKVIFHIVENGVYSCVGVRINRADEPGSVYRVSERRAETGQLEQRLGRT